MGRHAFLPTHFAPFAANIASSSLPISRRVSGMRILIVDDNASMRILLSTLMSDRGHQVVGSLADGNGVMEAVDRLKPEIVCLDYQLPGRDGLEILDEINNTRPEIDVLFITASEDPEIEQRAADAGAAGFLRKPFGQKQVLDEIQAVVTTREHANAAERQGEAPATAQTPNGSPGPRPGQRPRAVIADDNSSIRLLLKGLLSELGLDIVAQAANGEEAVKAAQTYQPAVLFLDVNMPLLSGLEALPKIRQVSPQTAVVMVTGSASRELVEQAAAGGARGYVVKPVRPAYLEAFVKKLFNR